MQQAIDVDINFKNALQGVNESFRKLGDSAGRTRDAVSQALNKIREILKVQTQEELDQIAKVEGNRKDLIELQLSGASQSVIDQKRKELDQYELELSLIQQTDKALDTAQTAKAARIPELTDIQNKAAELEKLPYEQALKYLNEIFLVEFEIAEKEQTRIAIEQSKARIDQFRKEAEERDRILSGEPSSAFGRGLDKFFMGAISASNRNAQKTSRQQSKELTNRGFL